MARKKGKQKGAVPDIPHVPPIPEKEESRSWRVCAGRSVTSMRGILGEGEEVKASFLSTDSAIESLEARGVIEPI